MPPVATLPLAFVTWKLLRHGVAGSCHVACLEICHVHVSDDHLLEQPASDSKAISTERSRRWSLAIHVSPTQYPGRGDTRLRNRLAILHCLQPSGDWRSGRDALQLLAEVCLHGLVSQGCPRCESVAHILWNVPDRDLYRHGCDVPPLTASSVHRCAAIENRGWSTRCLAERQPRRLAQLAECLVHVEHLDCRHPHRPRRLQVDAEVV